MAMGCIASSETLICGGQGCKIDQRERPLCHQLVQSPRSVCRLQVKKNPQFKCKKYNRRTASNGLRSALLNFYKKEGAKEYKESKQVNAKDEVVERQFQMPPRVFASLFGEVQLTEKSEQDRQETSSTASEVHLY